MTPSFRLARAPGGMLCVCLASLFVLMTPPSAPVMAQPEPATRGPAIPSQLVFSSAPLAAVTPVRRFDGPEQPWLPGHRGVDLAAQWGEQVFAPGEGVIAFAGVVAGKNVVSIDHPGGIRTTYEPVRATVHAGDYVPAGATIGHIAGAHPQCLAAACLHWGARLSAVQDSYFDPLTLLSGRFVPIVLKPLDGASLTPPF